MRTSPDLRIGCLIMAAGSASRFGCNKLLTAVDGQTLLERTLCAVPTELFSAVTVVTQYDEVARLSEKFGFSVLRNDRPQAGISRTIALGTAAMSDCDGILYLVCDQPYLRAQTITRIVQTWQTQPDKIVGAVHGAQRGNPNLFPARFFPALLALEGDCGGSRIIRSHLEAFLPVQTDARELFDCDTPQTLSELHATVSD